MVPCQQWTPQCSHGSVMSKPTNLPRLIGLRRLHAHRRRLLCMLILQGARLLMRAELSGCACGGPRRDHRGRLGGHGVARADGLVRGEVAGEGAPQVRRPLQDRPGAPRLRVHRHGGRYIMWCSKAMHHPEHALLFILHASVQSTVLLLLLLADTNMQRCSLLHGKHAHGG